MQVKNDQNCSWINQIDQRVNIKKVDSDLNCDWLIVGAGYTGLSAARKLGQLYPNQSIIIVDAQKAGEGASGRNSGYLVDTTLNDGFNSDKQLESGISMGIQKKKEISDKLSLEAKWDGYYFRDELTGYKRVDMEDYLQINWKISDKLILTNIFDYNDIKGRKYYKFKIGVEYDLGRD